MRHAFQAVVKAVLSGSLAISPLVVAGCGDDDALGPGGQDGGGDAASLVVVQALDNRFDPQTLTVPLGTTVQWTNVGSNPHTVTSGHGSGSPGVGSGFDAQLAPGQSFSHTFSTTGEHPYFCRIHESLGMTGNITVNP